MSYPNTLAADSYSGKIGEVDVEWTYNAKGRLASDARAKEGNPVALKAATEYLAYLSAQRLGKTRIAITGSLHNTTTVTSTGETRADDDHFTVTLNPGNMKVHIYLDHIVHGWSAFDNLTVKGESVVKRSKREPDPELSIGTYPTLQN